MAQWFVVAHEDFPIWLVARRVIERERIDAHRVKWLVEASESVRFFPTSRLGIHSVEPAEAKAEPAEAKAEPAETKEELAA